MPSPPARDEWRFTGTPGRSAAKVRLAEVAGRQFGRVRWDQILEAGVSEKTLRRWVGDGYLERVLPRVYAVGHTAPSLHADLAAALLYAGPGAMLSYATAVWWWGWLDSPTEPIILSTPRRVESLPGIKIHSRRDHHRAWRRGLPVTTADRTLLDFATAARPDRLRFVLANADYHHDLDLDELDALMGRGIDGTVALRTALQRHRPELARTRSELERRMIALAEAHGLPIPRCNVPLHGHLVDALWSDAKLIVELDGYDGHRTPAQLRADHRRDLELRAAGYVVLRYSWELLTLHPEAVAADIRRHLALGDPIS